MGEGHSQIIGDGDAWPHWPPFLINSVSPVEPFFVCLFVCWGVCFVRFFVLFCSHPVNPFVNNSQSIFGYLSNNPLVCQHFVTMLTNKGVVNILSKCWQARGLSTKCWQARGLSTFCQNVDKQGGCQHFDKMLTNKRVVNILSKCSYLFSKLLSKFVFCLENWPFDPASFFLLTEWTPFVEKISHQPKDPLFRVVVWAPMSFPKLISLPPPSPELAHHQRNIFTYLSSRVFTGLLDCFSCCVVCSSFFYCLFVCFSLFD